MSPSVPHPGTRRALAGLAGLSLGLAAAVVVLVYERGQNDPRELVARAIEDEGVRADALARLVAGAEGVWDSFPDADVGRRLQPGVEGREFRGVDVASNAFGMREEPFEAVKPAGTTRVVLLGDSFVFGYKVEARDRLGVFLREFLLQRGVTGPVECLHLAASSWNVLAETAFVRRQLAALQPDLVVQVIVANDLDDTRGARGFGALGSYSPQVRARAGGLVSQLTPRRLWPKRLQTYLLYAIDHESRERYDLARHEIERLARAVEATGGRYLLLSAWESFSPMVAAHLASGLRDDQVAYVSQRFTADLSFRIDATDRHWNRAGHERVAQTLYALIQRRGLLPGHELEPWDTATEAAAALHGQGRSEASFVTEYEALLLEKARDQIRSGIDFGALERMTAKQVYAGIASNGAAGEVAPYASLVLAREGGTHLALSGTRFAGATLEGGVATVSVDGTPLGTIALHGAEQGIDERWALPAEASGREFVSVRIESDDYVYTDASVGSCAAFLLRSIRIE